MSTTAGPVDESSKSSIPRDVADPAYCSTCASPCSRAVGIAARSPANAVHTSRVHAWFTKRKSAIGLEASLRRSSGDAAARRASSGSSRAATGDRRGCGRVGSPLVQPETRTPPASRSWRQL